ncbi:Sulfotransferase domain-containing protein [Monaibacterium marinum]|uniref:Sulfotransferase domain-containing protein n=1 Tax=Pontivivens marinum TaxID=1690039 RepID=A0A2C9CW16_9RHOB|nr:sulfotransferase domain-containing protein [Monaibacterium marinum]SOH95458.1 Sulfotransferase domain-containing protein [Monaibacterium marinum]
MTSKLNRLIWDLDRFGFSPRKLSLRLNLEKSAQVQPLFLISPPKSGTHLLERALCLSAQIYRPVTRTLNPRNIASLGGWGRHISRLRSGQLLVSHAHYEPEIAQLLQQTGAKKFLMVRDPRAMVLSDAHYLLKDTKHPMHAHIADKTLEERIDFCIEAPEFWQGHTFVELMLAFIAWADEPDTLVVRFEDLTHPDADRRTNEVARILAHAGLEPDRAAAAQIATEAVSPVSPTYRSGRTDEWRTVLSSDQITLIENSASSFISKFGY